MLILGLILIWILSLGVEEKTKLEPKKNGSQKSSVFRGKQKRLDRDFLEGGRGNGSTTPRLLTMFTIHKEKKQKDEKMMEIG